MSAPPAILALHGNLGAPADWDLPDLPNIHPIDLWDRVGLDFSEFAAALAGPLSAGLGKPVLAGYSLGGRLALHALAAFPGRWSAALVVSAHPGLGCVEDRLARRSSDAIWAGRARTMEWGAFLDRWNAQPFFGEAPAALRARQESLEPRREAIATAFETWSLGRQEDLRRRLGRFAGPVVWITGERDARFTGLGAEMAAVFPDFRHVVVPGAGHRVLEEGAEEVGREISRLVDKASSSAASGW
jgi:2-succinyl-6-hydroxy-2,4-cyclohexadiene-1-carboxylate synthase